LKLTTLVQFADLMRKMGPELRQLNPAASMYGSAAGVGEEDDYRHASDDDEDDDEFTQERQAKRVGEMV
jgi:hypothetical protein